MNISKKEIFSKAHQMAKTFEGNYRACFSLALKEIYSAINAFVAERQEEKELVEINRKLRVNFGSEIRNTQLCLKTGTYEIRETLKKLGFKYQPSMKTWIIVSDNIVEIAKAVLAA